MILKFYKSDNLIVLASLPIIAVVFWLPGILNPTDIDFQNVSPLFQWVNDGLSLVYSRVLAMAIVIVSALTINGVINNNEIFDRNTFLPALIYLIFMSAIKEYQVLSPIVISNFFWILAFRRLFNVYRQIPCKNEVFDATVLLLLGALFYLPSIIMLPIVWVALRILRPFVWREWVIPFFAFIIFGIYWFVSLLWGAGFEAWSGYFSFTSGQYSAISVNVSWPYYIVLFVLIILVNLSGYQISKQSKGSSLRFRKIITFFTLIIILTIVTLLFVKYFSDENVYTLIGAVPLSLLITFYFNYAKKAWLSQLFFYATFILLLVNAYLF